MRRRARPIPTLFTQEDAAAAPPSHLREVAVEILALLDQYQALRRVPADRAASTREDVRKWADRAVETGNERELTGYRSYLRGQVAERSKRATG